MFFEFETITVFLTLKVIEFDICKVIELDRQSIIEFEARMLSSLRLKGYQV